ncbi:hypothetical protein AAFF_G00024270 [Aldrovandia affinis]|uniref:Uncharacterized protein n=1 Tax=Aldrovandia affinis TaxID=143900 RepID=A0AAD7T5P7_9TELE|nr:hypothetical protein AAFF_G00024270 [Aldrovandia affinis]
MGMEAFAVREGIIRWVVAKRRRPPVAKWGVYLFWTLGAALSPQPPSIRCADTRLRSCSGGPRTGPAGAANQPHSWARQGHGDLNLWFLINPSANKFIGAPYGLLRHSALALFTLAHCFHSSTVYLLGHSQEGRRMPWDQRRGRKEQSTEKGPLGPELSPKPSPKADLLP